MTPVKWVEIVAWAVFWTGILVMLARAALRLRSPAQKYRTGWILAVTMMASAPLFVIVYTLGALGAAETFFGDGTARRGPWFMVAVSVVITALAPGALRRTRRGLDEHT